MANIGFSQRRTLVYLYGVGAGARRAGARASFRALQRQPRPLRRGLDHRDDRLRRRRRGRERLPGVRARDPEAAHLAPPAARRACAARRAPTRRRSTRGSRASSRPGTFAALDPKTGELESIDPDTGGVRGVERECIGPGPWSPGFGYIRARRLAPAPAGTARLSLPLEPVRLFRPDFETPDDRDARLGGRMPAAAGALIDRRDRWPAPRRGTGSARSSALRSRSASRGSSRGSSWGLPLSTLAIDGSSRPPQRRRRGMALRYADLVLLALALPVFIVAGWPLLGYAVAGRRVARAARHPAARRAPRDALAGRAATAERRSGRSRPRRSGPRLADRRSRSCSSGARRARGRPRRGAAQPRPRHAVPRQPGPGPAPHPEEVRR